MVKLIRFIGLVAQGIFLQFLHIVGLVAFLIAAAAGYFRLPSWTVPIMAVVFGVLADKLVDLVDVTGILEKAKAAHERGGFLIVVYFVISAVGYVAGGYGRHYLQQMKNGKGTKGTEPAKK
jgi:hypothetical protein